MNDYWRTVFALLWISGIASLLLLGALSLWARWRDNRRWDRYWADARRKARLPD